MIIVMQPGADEAAVQTVIDAIRRQGLHEHVSRGQEYTIIGAVGDERVFDPAEIERLPQVEKAIRIMHDWRIISREAWADDTVITLRGVTFGTGSLKNIAAVSGSQPLPEYGHADSILLDPFYLPAAPYTHVSGSLNETAAAKTMQQHIQTVQARKQPIGVRVRDSRHIQAALNAGADWLYLGGELLQNRHILHETGSLNIPVLVGKGTAMSIREWLTAAEHIVLRGNQHVMLGDAGTLAFQRDYAVPDTDAIAQAKALSHLPVLADISHLSQRHIHTDTLAAIVAAAGVHGIIRSI